MLHGFSMKKITFFFSVLHIERHVFDKMSKRNIKIKKTQQRDTIIQKNWRMFTFAAVAAAAGSAIEGSWVSGEVSWGGSEKEMVRLEKKMMITKPLTVLWKPCPFGTNPKLHFLFSFSSLPLQREEKVERTNGRVPALYSLQNRVARTSKL